MPSTGASTGEPGAGEVTVEGVKTDAHASGHGMEMAGSGTGEWHRRRHSPGTRRTDRTAGSDGIGTTVTGAIRTGTAGAVTTGVAGGLELAPARAADAATGRGGSAARAG